MAEPRRRRAATEEKLTRLLDVTEEIILREGYAAVSSRNVAARVGNPGASCCTTTSRPSTTCSSPCCGGAPSRTSRRWRQLWQSPEPFSAWWQLASDPRGAALLLEFIAAANHRPALKEEVGKVAHEVRRMQMKTLSRLLPEYGLDAEDFPPAFIAAAMQGISFAIVADEAAGFDTDHAQARGAMDRLVMLLEKRRRGNASE